MSHNGERWWGKSTEAQTFPNLFHCFAPKAPLQAHNTIWHDEVHIRLLFSLKLVIMCLSGSLRHVRATTRSIPRVQCEQRGWPQLSWAFIWHQRMCFQGAVPTIKKTSLQIICQVHFTPVTVTFSAERRMKRGMKTADPVVSVGTLSCSLKPTGWISSQHLQVINCPQKSPLKYGQFKCPRCLPAFTEGVCLRRAEVPED